MKVIVTDCKYKMSLAPIRSLHDGGYEVVCGEYDDVPDKALLGSRSKCGAGLLRYGRQTPAQSIAALCDDGDVILPTGRVTLRSLGEHPELKSRVAFLASDPATLDRADDKAYIRELARRLDIPAPETFYQQPEETDEALAGRVNYPAIIKYKNGEALGLKSWERYTVASTPAELIAGLEKLRRRSDELLVQDYLTGQDVGAAVVMDDKSRPVDFILYVSDREYPLSGGPTCLCRTVFDRQLLKYACKILAELNFTGIAMLDFKGSPEQPYLLEINPRIWGSAALCHVAGSSFFTSYVKAAQGIGSPLDLDTCQPTYPVGARMKFVPHCLLAALSLLKQGRVGPAFHDVRAALSPKVRDGLAQRGDNRPFRRYLINLFTGKE
jgi:predicted ATP-grasp superfamily ATP-dependent carboligase